MSMREKTSHLFPKYPLKFPKEQPVAVINLTGNFDIHKLSPLELRDRLNEVITETPAEFADSLEIEHDFDYGEYECSRIVYKKPDSEWVQVGVPTLETWFQVDGHEVRSREVWVARREGKIMGIVGTDQRRSSIGNEAVWQGEEWSLWGNTLYQSYETAEGVALRLKRESAVRLREQIERQRKDLQQRLAHLEEQERDLGL